MYLRLSSSRLGREVGGDPLAEKEPDVVELLVARGVDSRLLGRHEILPGPFGHHDHRVVAAPDPRRARCASRPPGPSSAKGTSGIST